MTSEADDWTGSSWERVCRDLFDGDEARMLAWARRYLAAYPGVNDREFHLGAGFRSIVGPRNREQWWRKAVALLEARSGAASGSVRAPRAASGSRPASVQPQNRYDARPPHPPPGAPRPHATAVGEVPPPAYATPPMRVHSPPGTVEDRLRAFNEAMERADRRARGEPGFPAHIPPTGRGWSREELYDRGRRD